MEIKARWRKACQQQFAFILSIFMCGCVVFWCHSSLAQPPTFRVAIASAPLSLNPLYATDAASVRLMQTLSYGLLQRDETYRYHPAAAKQWTWLSPTELRVDLNQAEMLGNEPLTAEHVKKFYTRILEAEPASALKSQLSGVHRIEIDTSHSLRFILKESDVWFERVLTWPLIWMQEGKPMGLRSDVRFITQKTDGSVLLQQGERLFELVVQKDPAVRLLALRRGDVQAVYNDMPIEMVNYAQQQGVKIWHSPSASYTYLGFRIDGGVTADKNVRSALAQALDIRAIRQVLLDSYAQEASSLLLPNHPGHWPAPGYEYNPQLAAKTLENAGYTRNDEGFFVTVTLTLTTNPLSIRAGQIMREMAAQAGIGLELRTLDWGTFYAQVKEGSLQAFLLSWVGDFDADIFYFLFHSTQIPPNGLNRGRYSNLQMDKVLETLLHTEDTAKRADMGIQVQKIQHEDVVYLPLWRGHHVLLTQPTVQGCQIAADGRFSGLLSCRTVPAAN